MVMLSSCTHRVWWCQQDIVCYARSLCHCFANDIPPWSAYYELMTGHLLALDKNQGVCPISINDTWCQMVAKCILQVAGPASTWSMWCWSTLCQLVCWYWRCCSPHATCLGCQTCFWRMGISAHWCLQCFQWAQSDNYAVDCLTWVALWYSVLLQYLIVTGVNWKSITRNALVTFFSVRKVLHRGILWLVWWLMVSPPSHSCSHPRLSSLNFSMLGMLMTLQWLGLRCSFPIIFTIQ